MTYPVRTTIKSNIFQTFRKYEPLWSINPSAKIFRVASTQKMAKKYGSETSYKQIQITIISEI
jgi:hypothetical protein